MQEHEEFPGMAFEEDLKVSWKRSNETSPVLPTYFLASFVFFYRAADAGVQAQQVEGSGRPLVGTAAQPKRIAALLSKREHTRFPNFAGPLESERRLLQVHTLQLHALSSSIKAFFSASRLSWLEQVYTSFIDKVQRFPGADVLC